MSRFPSLPLFTDAFIADTQHLDARETGAYLLLLMMAWRSPECRIPDDDKLLARWARMDLRGWRHTKSVVMQFWDLEEGFYTQKRLRKEYEYVRKSAAVSRTNIQARWLKNRPAKPLKNNETAIPAVIPNAYQTDTPNPNPNQIQKDAPLNRASSVSGKSGSQPNGECTATPEELERRRLKVEEAKRKLDAVVAAAELGYDTQH